MASLMLVIILGIVTQCVDGNQRIVQVSELLSDDEDYIGSSDISLSCCVYGNCSCSSLDHALANLTSNVLINITIDVTFSSLIEASNLQNISIIGHNNPTVNCRNVAGIHFNFCYNCIIQGVTWDGCGVNKLWPALKWTFSSNITIQACFFQHSIGQAVVLSEVSENVNINHCQFVYNGHYKGHGAGVYYSSSNLQNLLTISNCSFSYNKDAKSLVYIQNTILQSQNNDSITFQHSKFCHNQGVISIYVANQRLSLSGELLFQNNTAKIGPGIYIHYYSSVEFGENSNVTFIQNYAIHGVVFLSSHSNVSFDKNSQIEFKYNNATIYSVANSDVIFTGNCEVTFTSNSAPHHGALIYSSDNSHVTFSGNSKVTFNNNEGSKTLHSHRKWPPNGVIILSVKHSNISFKGS